MQKKTIKNGSKTTSDTRQKTQRKNKKDELKSYLNDQNGI